MAVSALMLVAVPALADQGMWMPEQIPDLAERLSSLGFTGDPKAFADLTGDPMGAVVSLGGCTASFVSPEGLLVTNHHCAVGALQFNSTKERDLLRDGYLARTRADELSIGPGGRAWVTTTVTDVTDAVLAKIPAQITDRQLADLIERRLKERVASCEKSGERCRVASYFEGLKYYEIAQLEIQDLRLVYAPPEGIGVFGGETDNWHWPRHTGDWTFYRAYVARGGEGAPFSKDNVPYRPKRWLRVDPSGAKEGELVFVIGYPGRTERHQTYAEVEETTEWAFPRRIRIAQEQLRILEELARSDRELGIKATSRIRGLANSLQNRQGQLEGLRKGGILATKERQDRELREWIAADPERAKQYGSALEGFDALFAARAKTRDRDAALSAVMSFSPASASSSLLQSAYSLYLLSQEKAKKKDLDREGGFQERDFGRIREAIERQQRSLDVRIDRALLRHALLEAAALPADERIAALDTALGLAPGQTTLQAGKAIDACLDRVYAGTRMLDQDFRLGLLDASTAEIVATRDPFVELALTLDPAARAVHEQNRQDRGTRARLGPTYMKALLTRSAGLVAPDANGTLRVTYGRVQGVPIRDGVYYRPFTTLQGILDKHTGQGEFDAPARELAAIRARRERPATARYLDPALGDVPVNFLSDVDSTGGNSGSPTIDGKGELVGLLFDGTYETIASDFLFDPVRTRSIHVDVRYLLWTAAEVDGAQGVVDELLK